MKNYRVLIVDDEYYIRQRIKKIICWDQHPIEFAGEAENGDEAIQMLASGIDIVLLDIKMPGMSGIDVAEYIHHNYPATKVIILSGFDEFQYAQKAITYGVSDYLLKPVESSQLDDAIAKVTKQIAQHRSSMAQQAASLEYQKSKQFDRVLNQKLSWQEFTSAHSEFRQKTHCAAAGVYAPEGYEHVFEDITAELSGSGTVYISVPENDNAFVFYVFFEQEKEYTRLQKIFSDYVSGIHSAVFVVLGKCFSAFGEEWKTSGSIIPEELLHRYFISLPAFRLESELPEENLGMASDLMRARSKLVSCINTADKSGTKELLDALFDTTAQVKSTEYLRLVVNEVASTLIMMRISPQTSEGRLKRVALSFLDEEYTPAHLSEHFMELSLQWMDSQNCVPSDVAVAKKITGFIEANYTDPDLSVASLADLYGMNISYMGSIFKKVKGLSIRQYITNLRMEAAAELLAKKQKKISEIAVMVGYSDVFYFSKRFKAVFGVSPKDYGKNI